LGLDPADLDRSLELGRTYLLNCQRPNGSFIYERHAERGTDLVTRHATREMGGLWGLALFHRQNPTPETAAAIARALEHYARHAKRTATGGLYLCEPAAIEGSTNLMALYVLSLQDFLAADQDLVADRRAAIERDLSDAVTFLLSLRLPGGRFAAAYRCPDGRGIGSPNPYADGEVLLALTRAAKAEGADPNLRTIVLESAAVMYGEYVRTALRANPDSDDTKGFYQWGSMAFYELFTTGWPGTQPYAARAIALARWMTDVHGVTERGRNNGYAFEGLAVAWELARLTGDTRNEKHIADAIAQGFSKLLSLQIGSPVAGNAVPPSFLKHPDVRGGVLNQPGDPRLRIDTTQHQMHAAMLIRWLLLRDDEAPDAAAAGR
jgi:UDP-N-acetylmuramoyl-tripeptide--D-alanyl-D-alanine ligase